MRSRSAATRRAFFSKASSPSRFTSLASPSSTPRSARRACSASWARRCWRRSSSSKRLASAAFCANCCAEVSSSVCSSASRPSISWPRCASKLCCDLASCSCRESRSTLSLSCCIFSSCPPTRRLASDSARRALPDSISSRSLRILSCTTRSLRSSTAFLRLPSCSSLLASCFRRELCCFRSWDSLYFCRSLFNSCCSSSFCCSKCWAFCCHCSAEARCCSASSLCCSAKLAWRCASCTWTWSSWLCS
mmetsp:Transcript_25696/g.61279  ORF Transcript_25696/g.61279 Transcript_25696/m.61279 type:complete len:248 (+) Transcript_25696:300-1043(+)